MIVKEVFEMVKGKRLPKAGVGVSEGRGVGGVGEGAIAPSLHLSLEKIYAEKLV
jgi:hypothetical protein